VIFLATCSSFLCAQISEPPPDTLLDAGHCLAATDRDWLDVARERPFEVELGYVSAEKSESGKAVPLYLIEFTTPTHTDGFVFVFLSRDKESHSDFLKRNKESHSDLLLQSRIRFHQSDDGSQQIRLVDPPLGGVGTQDAILAAIQKVGFHTWKVPVADLVHHAGAVNCDTAEGVM
jgi:hypothetical protein